jgi:beta-glucosidase
MSHVTPDLQPATAVSSVTKEAADPLDLLIAALDVGEKAALLNGEGMWRTASISRLGISSVTMTDGTHGVRLSKGQLAHDASPDAALAEFLAMLNSGSDEKAEFGASLPSTCYPAACAYGCSWDIDLARELGRHLAMECRAMGIDLLLGPGANLRRTPLAGRGYEYYSEDPILTGEMAGAVISGLQDNGVGAVLKHFACNESEVDRTRMNSLVSPRALREIYLKAFERAIERGRPWAVMSGYNLLNGEQTAESHWLLTQVLRRDWDFDGVVMSDWHGIKDRPASLRAGNDLDMPQSVDRTEELRAAIGRDAADSDRLDESCRRVLQLVHRVEKGRSILPTNGDEDHHAFARRIAEQSIVLLKNEGSLLPLCPDRPAKLALVGPTIERPLIQGVGSSRISPNRVDDIAEEIRAVCSAAGEVSCFSGWSSDTDERERRIAQALAGAAAADIAIVFVNVPEENRGGEETDRPHLRLADGQDELVSRVVRAQPKTIVILFAPDAVIMPWIDDVPALVAPFFAGQGMAQALARLLFGLANPSGKLTTSFPVREEELPAFPYHPGEGRILWYGEDIFPGYRSFDRKQIEPLFPFGHGLSYTRFRYADLMVDPPEIREDGLVRARFTLTNSGDRDGSEICQLYASWPQAVGNDPVRELKAFRKIFLRAGESREIEITVPAKDLRRWRALGSEAQSGWVFGSGPLRIEIGSSSRSLQLVEHLHGMAEQNSRSALDIFSLPKEVLTGDDECQVMRAFLTEQLGLSEEQAEAFMPVLRSSFLGIGTTLQWFAGDRIKSSDVRGLLDRIQAIPPRAIELEAR